MAVVTRSCNVFPCVRDSCYKLRTSKHGWTVKSLIELIKTQLCTVALTVSAANLVRLPREAFKHGAVPYLVVYCFWLLAAGLPITLLQLAMGQLSHQDPIGVWRAVPILKGVGHLKVLTSYLCCVYNMLYVALALAYLIWIAKGSFPLKDCTRLQLTPNGYENRMNASECFNSTFLAPFTEYPQYLGIMAILIFVLWFILPVFLYRLHKSLKITLSILSLLVIAIAIVLYTFLADWSLLKDVLLSCEQWMPLTQPYIWQSALVQALLSTQIVSGYLVSAGGTIYNKSDVRWSSASIILGNMMSGWFWVFLWQTIGGEGRKDTSFVGILVTIYQSSVSESRAKMWPMLSFGIVFLSGIISVLFLLFPIFDKFHKIAELHWKILAAAVSTLGTALTVAVLSRGIEVATILDELALPVLAMFTAAVEVVGFVFIYGWLYLAVDIEFLTGSRLPCIWIGTWWSTPVFLVGVAGWWLRAVLRNTWGQSQTLWPLVGVFMGILLVMAVMAAIAVAKEEQFNLLTKFTAAFAPSRMWGPEEPMARYVWMSQRYASETLSSLRDDTSSEPNNYSTIVYNTANDKKLHENWINDTHTYQRAYNVYSNTDFGIKPKKKSPIPNHVISIPRNKKKKVEPKFRSPNICIAKGQLGGPVNCNCNRHFTLNVPTLGKDSTTSL